MSDLEKIKRLVLEQRGRPKNLDDVKVVHVFEDRYRINLWVREEEDGLHKNKIGASYFVRFDGDKIHIKEDEGREKEDR